MSKNKKTKHANAKQQKCKSNAASNLFDRLSKDKSALEGTKELKESDVKLLLDFTNSLDNKIRIIVYLFYVNGWYKRLGYKHFNKFVKSELTISYYRAMDYANAGVAAQKFEDSNAITKYSVASMLEMKDLTEEQAKSVAKYIKDKHGDVNRKTVTTSRVKNAMKDLGYANGKANHKTDNEADNIIDGEYSVCKESDKNPDEFLLEFDEQFNDICFEKSHFKNSAFRFLESVKNIQSEKIGVKLLFKELIKFIADNKPEHIDYMNKALKKLIKSLEQ